jgi:hypothetical protein
MTNEIVYIPNYNEKFIKGIIRIRLKNKSDHKVINEINNHCRLTKYIPTKEYNLRETKLSEIYLRKHYRTSYTENYCNFNLRLQTEYIDIETTQDLCDWLDILYIVFTKKIINRFVKFNKEIFFVGKHMIEIHHIKINEALISFLKHKKYNDKNTTFLENEFSKNSNNFKNFDEYADAKIKSLLHTSGIDYIDHLNKEYNKKHNINQ